MAKTNAQNLPSKKVELLKHLDHLKVELSQVHIAQVTGGIWSKLPETWAVCQSVTLVLTIINQIQKENLRKFISPRICCPKQHVPCTTGSTSTSTRRTWRSRNSSWRSSHRGPTVGTHSQGQSIGINKTHTDWGRSREVSGCTGFEGRGKGP